MKEEMIYGVQYYRAPTPVREEWAQDLENIKKHGFNTIKIWAVWRKNHPEKERYDFEDLDELMDLAIEQGLHVIINVIMDAAPAWLYEEYPDSIMEMENGRKLHPQAPLYRQTGGAPGPCYHHKEASEYKSRFIRKLVARYCHHEALLCWDLWNEPELTCGLARQAEQQTMVCYCKASQETFQKWLEKKYSTIEQLNAAWQRNYQSFSQVEVPRSGDTFSDMIDWRTFFAETLTDDLRERVRIVKDLDIQHPVMVHTVPIPYFNMVNACCNDYQMAKLCDMYGNSIGNEPYMAVMTANTSGDKMPVNAEMHIINGETFQRTPVQTYKDFKQYIYTPLAHGIKGFLYWQYRPERCGKEGPAWGLTTMAGGDHKYLEYAERIGRRLEKYSETLLSAKPLKGKIVLVKDNKNEIFTWCADNDVEIYFQSLLGAFDAFYTLNYQVDIKSAEQLMEEGTDDYLMVYYPFPYYMTKPVSQMLLEYVRGGGMLVSEAFFGAYQGEINLHSEIIPGYGFDELFGAREEQSYSAKTLKAAYGINWSSENKDKDRINLCGGIFQEKYHFSGYYFLESLLTETGRKIGQTCGDRPMTVMNGNNFGSGKAVLCGTLLGAAYYLYKESGTLRMFDELARLAGITKNAAGVPEGVRADILTGEKGNVIVLRNNGGEGRGLHISFPSDMSQNNKSYIDIETEKQFMTDEKGGLEVYLEENDIMVLAETTEKS